jgi:transposase
LAPAEKAIRAAVKAQADATLTELRETIAQATGIVASPSMLSRELVRLNLPLKKSRFMRASGTRRG